MTALILFGAGASYGSEISPHPTPPLGKDLFNELVNVSPIAKSVPEHIKAEFRRDFEIGMALYSDYAEGDVKGFQRELGQFLFGFSATPDSAYVRLIEKIGTHRAVFSSLNYDMLFETAAEISGLYFCYNLNRYDNCIRMLKIHGSVNVWPDFGTNTVYLGNFSGNKYDVKAPTKLLDFRDTEHMFKNHNGSCPSIAVYAEGKLVKMCPEFVEGQYSLWIEIVRKAKRIFVVGARVNEVDEHIWGPLGRTKAALTYFGMARDKNQFVLWQSNHGKQNAYFCESDFRGCVDIIGRRLRG